LIFFFVSFWLLYLMSLVQPGHEFYRKRSKYGNRVHDDGEPVWSFPLLDRKGQNTQQASDLSSVNNVQPELQNSEIILDEEEKGQRQQLLPEEVIGSRKRKRNDTDLARPMNVNLQIGVQLTQSLMDGPFLADCYSDSEVKVETYSYGVMKLSCINIPVCTPGLMEEVQRHAGLHGMTAVLYWSHDPSATTTTTTTTTIIGPTLICFLLKHSLVDTPTDFLPTFVQNHDTLLGFTQSSDTPIHPKHLDRNSLYVFQRLPLPWKKFIRPLLSIDVVNGTTTATLEHTVRHSTVDAKQLPLSIVWQLTPLVGSWVLPLIDLKQMSTQMEHMECPPYVDVQWAVRVGSLLGGHLELVCVMQLQRHDGVQDLTELPVSKLDL
jgi:hypothetical protein